MSIIDMISKVTTVYKADTTQHRLAIRELSGDQKKAAQEELKRIEAGNAGIDSQVKKLAKLAVIVGTVGVAAKVAFDSLEFAGRRADLQATANIESMDGLKKATRGLMTETQLLEAAARIQQGTMKLSQKEMEAVTGAITAMGEKGNDAAAVTEAFTTALITGKTKGLKAFGIEVYEGGNRLETHNQILAKAAELTKDFSKEQLDASDKMSQAKVKLTDAFDNVKVSLAGAGEALTPLVSGFATLVQKLTDVGLVGPVAIAALALAITGNPAIAAIIALGTLDGEFDPRAEFNKQEKRKGMKNRQMGLGGLEAAQRLQAQVGGMTELDVFDVEVKSIPAIEKAAKAAAALYEEMSKLYNARFHPMAPYLDTEAEAFKRYAAALELAKEDIDDGEEGRLRMKGWASGGQQVSASMAGLDLSSAQASGSMGGMEGFLKQTRESLEQIEFDRADEPTLLERTIGPIDQFDAYGAAFQGMTDVMVGAYEAIINGSEGSAAALKKIAASAMMTVGKGMLVEGIKHQALAIGDLASENYKGFVMHQTAAAKNFAGAAIVGGIAAALGGTGSVGGGGSGRSAASAPAYQGPNKTGYQGGSNVTIVYGDQFADDSPRNRQRTAQKLVGRALGTSGGTYS